MKIKSWYVKEFPMDNLGKEINKRATFQDVQNCLDDHSDIYELLSVYDSIVRERVFEKLALILKLPYSTIYNRWLNIC